MRRSLPRRGSWAGSCEALASAVNRERINKELLEGRVFDIDSPFDVGWMQCQVETFTWGGYRYSNARDAVAAAKRGDKK